MKNLLVTMVDASRLGGYVRAAVAGGLSLAIAKIPGLKDILDPSTQAALGVFLSGVVVGLWSHYVKNGESK